MIEFPYFNKWYCYAKCQWWSSFPCSVFLKSGFMYVYAKLFPLISVFCYSLPRFCTVSISCSLQGLILLSSVHLSVCHASVCLSDEADGTCVPCGCFHFCFLYEYSLPIHCLPSWVISPSFHYSVIVCTMPTFLKLFFFGIFILHVYLIQHIPLLGCFPLFPSCKRTPWYRNVICFRPQL